MNLIDKKIKVGPKKSFVENLLVIEGITRSGKFLLANILSGLEEIEPSQYSGLLEQIPFLASFGLIEKQTAKQLIRCEVDMRCYEMLIGRNLNYRLSDKSSIYKIPNYKKLVARSRNSNIEDMISQFKKEKPYSPFILHESMSLIEIYFETFPKMKCISIQRNPIDLAYSWYKRGLGRRWGEDPLLLQIPFMKENYKGKFPWFAIGWEDLYLNLDEANRAVLSVKALIEKAQESYTQLTKETKKQILVIRYENLVSNSKGEIENLSNFLGKKTSPEMKKILTQEDLPKIGQAAKKKEKLKEMKAVVNKEYLDELLRLS